MSRRAARSEVARRRRRRSGREDWKFGFTGSQCEACGERHLPAGPVCANCGAVDQMRRCAWPTSPATVATFTVDRLTYTRARRSWPRCSTSTAAAGSAASSPTSTRDRRDRRPGRDDVPAHLHRRACTITSGRPARAALLGRGTRRDLTWRVTGFAIRVAIVGMGCTVFGEHWDKSADDLLVDAVADALVSAGVEQGRGRRVLARHDGLRHLRAHAVAPVAHRLQAGHAVENMCATGSESFRNACYAVASGAFDMVMATGVEKLKDGGFSGLAVSVAPVRRHHGRAQRARAVQPARPAYCKKYGVDADEFKDVLTRIAWKNHRNGAEPPRRSSARRCRRRRSRARRSWPATSASSTARACPTAPAAAVIVRAEDASRLHRQADLREGPVVRGRPGAGVVDRDYDYTTFREVVAAADGRVPAGRRHRTRGRSSRWPRCTTASRPPSSCSWRTSGFAERGFAWKEELAGHLRSRRRAPGEPRRRAQGLRPPDRRVGPAHAVRVLAAAARARPASARSRPSRRARRSRSPTTSAARRASASATSASSGANPPRNAVRIPTQPNRFPVNNPGLVGFSDGRTSWSVGLEALVLLADDVGEVVLERLHARAQLAVERCRGSARRAAPALRALPMATVATGIPAGICTIDSSESSPSS